MFRTERSKQWACARAFHIAAIVVMVAGTNNSISYAQVPPPPPLHGQSNLAAKLAEAFAKNDVTAYASVLSDDLEVFEDGNKVASNKQEWLGSFGKRLGTTGIHFRIVSGYSSTGRILFIEYFNSLASWGKTPPPDCCWGYDAVAYDVKDGKVKTIRRLRGGDARLGENGEVLGN